jgi:N-acetylmuramoyl-L-alanine amidase
MLKTLISFIFLFHLNAYAEVVLIDPGHGGGDCGAKAKTWNKKRSKLKVTCEKDIALSIAKKIHEKVKKKYKSYLTRSVDREVTLDERSKLADKIGADIFISVHINASPKKSSNGFETYYLDNHNNQAVSKVEHVENRGIKGNQLVVNQILADLVIERTAPQSKLLANLIHNRIAWKVVKQHKMQDRGAKAALFYVLALSKRPAVLLEVGFLSNPKEMRKIMSPKFQNAYAEAVFQGIRKYFLKNKKRKINLF